MLQKIKELYGFRCEEVDSACAGMTARMLRKIKELYAIRGHFSVLTPYRHVEEPGMFMKTNQIVELAWNVIENRRVVRGPFPLKQRR